MSSKDGTIISELISLLNITQAEFSDRIGLNKSTVSALKSGKSKLTTRTKRVIATEFNVSMKWLDTGEGRDFIESDLDLVEKFIVSLRLKDKKARIIEKILLMEEKEVELIDTILRAKIRE